MDSNQIATFLLEEFDEMDELWEHLMGMIVTILDCSSTRMFRQPCMNSHFTGWKWLNEIILGNDTRCLNMFRMDKETLYLLCGELSNKYGLSPSRQMTILEKVCICIYILAQGAGNRRAQERFQHSGETISRIFHEVMVPLLRFARDQIKPQDPSFSSIPEEIRGDSRYMPYFKDCIGAIDGTHVPATVPSKDYIRYINRKGVPTQNIMAVCSFDMRFTFVVAGWEGSAHDARIFRETLDDNTLLFPKPPPGKYYLVDAWYPQIEGYLRPYRKTTYHLPEFQRGRHLRTYKEVFNRWHSSLRSCIERAFGVWKVRWKILRIMPSYGIDTQRNIVIATMALHNYIRTRTLGDPAFRMFDENPNYVPPGELRSSNDAEDEEAREITQSMNNLRDQIANNLWSARH